MAYMMWDDTKDIGHSIIDADHRAMADAISALGESIFLPAHKEKSGDRRERIEQSIHHLRTLAEQHFRSEEWIMETAGYPAMASHRGQHNDLLAEFDAFAGEFHKSGNESTAHAIRFLREWFEYHVLIWDKPLVDWLARQP